MPHAHTLYQRLLAALLATPMLTLAPGCAEEECPQGALTSSPEQYTLVESQDECQNPLWDGSWSMSTHTAGVLARPVCGDAQGRDLPCPQSIQLLEAPPWLPEEATAQGPITLHFNHRDENLCHYTFHIGEYQCEVEGRCLREGEETVISAPQHHARSPWGAPLAHIGGLEDIPASLRRTLGLLWTRSALAEHASVASFSRVSLEMMHKNAPPEILRGLQQAGVDEVEHARACFAIASAYLGHTVGPGTLPLPQARDLSWEEIAAETLQDGAITETVAVLYAMRAREHCQQDSVRAAWAAVIEDESRHAALAWKMVRWAIEQGGDSVREAVVQAAHEAKPKIRAVSVPAPPHLRRFFAQQGRLDDLQSIHTELDAWSECVEPLLRLVLAPV